MCRSIILRIDVFSFLQLIQLLPLKNQKFQYYFSIHLDGNIFFNEILVVYELQEAAQTESWEGRRGCPSNFCQCE